MKVKQRDFLIILIPLFILTVLWVVFNIYHNYVTTTIKDPLSFQIVPIEGSFDTQTIDKIKERQRINPLYEAIVTEAPTPTPTPTPLQEEEEILTPTPEISPTQTEEAAITPEPTEDTVSGGI